MDINILRAVATLLVFITFVAICVMVYSRKRKAYYAAAAQLVFDDEHDWPQTEVKK